MRKRSTIGALLTSAASAPLSMTHEARKAPPAQVLKLKLLRRPPPLYAAALQVDRDRHEERDGVADAEARDQQQERPDATLLEGAAAKLVQHRPRGRRARGPLCQLIIRMTRRRPPGASPSGATFLPTPRKWVGPAAAAVSPPLMDSSSTATARQSVNR